MAERRRMWYWHAFWVAVWPLYVVGALLFVALGSVAPDIASILGAGAVIILGGTALVAAFGSLVGYYTEARWLKEAGSHWVPTWWAYILAQLLLSPLLVAPIYVLQRWRHIGLRGELRLSKEERPGNDDAEHIPWE